MDFWNEYEGKTIVGKFPLQRLLYPEGRSGFFFTTNGTGVPAVIRITESMNDQEAMLEPWRTVRGMRQSNLVVIKDFGETEVDDTPLLFAVMETTDASLAEVLRERPMTVEETHQIVDSLIAALQGLHQSGLVHGHIEAENVYAVGEVIKLRSDCVRVVADGPEGSSMVARDVHDLCLLLLECLTQQRRQHSLALPAPFSEVIAQGISGAWGLQEISMSLHPMAGKNPPRVANQLRAAEEVSVIQDELAFPAPSEGAVDEDSQERIYPPAESFPRERGPWIAVAILLASVLLCGWLFAYLHRQKAPVTGRPVAVSAPAAVAPVPSPASAPVARVEDPAPPPTVKVTPVASDAGQVWRLVAYTYNRQSQAESKVLAIEKTHNSLKPEVFSPNGQAPYLVTLGGGMTREQAAAFKKKARSAGFPRDIYTQNYSSK